MAQSAPTLTVDAASNRHAINPNIYGIANYGLDATFAAEIHVPNVRWGGDGTTRYNWEVDSSNAGFDWFFMGGNGSSSPVPGASVDQMVSTYKSAGAGSLITIPIIPYVNSSAAWNCSFPVSVYGPQQSTNPYVFPNGQTCGNSISPSGTQLTDTNIYANHVANSTSLQQGWVQHLVATFGTASKGGVPFYQLDNEPFGWGNTHRDVQPGGTTYPTIVALGQQYAAMVKQQDPSASVLGPSDFTLGGWIGTPSQQNNLYAGQYYLQQMAAYQQAHGVRILDYFDEHYYPQFSDVASQLASTRTLWDPTYNGGTWVEQYYFDGPMQLIPRFQQWITQYYPGTRLAFSEYSIDSGHKVITDALSEADVLGIFGRQAVDFANMWNTPAPGDPIAYAFRLYRDYDGAGAQFGETGIQAASSDQGKLSIYGAERTSDGALTVVVLNKTSSAIQTTLSLANFNAAGSAALYSYSGANLSQIVSLGNVSLNANTLSYDYPAYSATVAVFAGSTGTQQPVANGTYKLTNGASHLVLDDPGLSKVAGTQMIQWTSNSGLNQKWTFVFSGGYYTIQSASSQLVLAAPASSGNELVQEPLPTGGATPPDNQRWSITGAAGAWVLHNKANGLVISDPGASTTKGTKIVVAGQGTGVNENWSIQ
ncbi:MAG TPA: glycoside hydrolase family 44 protein [Acidobacteriaceae bacterium]